MDEWNKEGSEGQENAEFSQEDFLNEDNPIVITDAQAQAQEAPKEEKKSSKVGSIIGVVIIIAGLIAIGVMGIRTLMLRGSAKTQSAEREITLEKGTWTKFQAYYGSPECVEYKHTVNFIPTAKEHYFFVFSADLSEMALVRADKKWFDENFTENWTSKDADGVTIEGYVRKTEYKVKDEADSSVKTLVSELGKSFRIDTSLYIDLIAVKFSIYEILIMLIPIVVAGIVFALSRVGLDGSMDSTPGKIVIVVAIIGFFVYGGFVLHVLAML